MPFRFDESDPQIIVVYTGDDHDISDYHDLTRRWLSRIETKQRVGVVMVNEPHDHEHDEDHEAETAALVQLINDFRRDYREASRPYSIGYANVYDLNEAWMPQYLDEQQNIKEEMQAAADQRARYMFGTRGRNFTDVESAKQWIRDIANLPPIEDSHETRTSANAPKRVGLFYGSTTGVTENIAYEIQAAWEATGAGDLPPTNIGTIKDLKNLLAYDYLILGAPTWNIGQLQDDWEIALPQLEKLDFLGKKAALFGIGDQYGYPDNFLDAIGILGRELRSRGATLVGFWDTDSYEFAESLAIENGQFMGLGIDEIHQSKLTQERIEAWVAQIIKEFALQVTV